MASHAMIDQCFWHFRWQHEVPTELIFLPFMCRLRFLEVYINLNSIMRDFNLLSSFMESLCISLTSPATLEHLKFNFQYRNNYYGWHYTLYGDLCNAGVWRHLDSITTHPTGSRLQRVDIKIDYYDHGIREFDQDLIEKTVLDGLPLLRTKGILFVEAVEAPTHME